MMINTMILKLLSDRRPERLTTYEIAKTIKISWSTASVHLYQLSASNKIKHKTEIVKHIKKTYWFL